DGSAAGVSKPASDEDLSVLVIASETGSTDQYQPERRSENRRSPRFGAPEIQPSSDAFTEAIRLNRCADSTVSNPRWLTCRKSAVITVAITTRAMIAQIDEIATIRNASVWVSPRICPSRFRGVAGKE